MVSHIQIRKAQTADIADVSQCAKAAYQQYVRVIGKKPAPMCADFDSLIEHGVVSIASSETGFAGFIVFYPGVGKTNGEHLFIENIAVLPELTGQGIGAALMSHAETCAKEKSVKIVRLYTNAKMTANLSWYVKLGYAETGRVYEDGFDRIYFEKKIF